MRKLLLVLAAAAAACFSATLYAEDYPSRPITIINPFGPGSASDTLCRIIADQLGPALGEPVIVEDRPGEGVTLSCENKRYRDQVIPRADLTRSGIKVLGKVVGWFQVP